MTKTDEIAERMRTWNLETYKFIYYSLRPCSTQYKFTTHNKSRSNYNLAI